MRESFASAPGKVNLVLRSGPPAADGYHPLATVFETVNLREYLRARTRKRPGIGVETRVYDPPVSPAGTPKLNEAATESLAALPTERHLAVRAAKALQPLISQKWGPSAAGLQLTVHKTIPVAAGMAGGSADAAAALVAVNDLWELGLSPAQLEAVGRNLGADVPACLRGGWSFGTGRGDHLESFGEENPGSPHWWALAFAEEGLSTPAVFAKFDEMNLGAQALPTTAGHLGIDPALPAEQLAEHLRNDLAEAALRLRPELAEVGGCALACGALGWMVSGSGPTVAALAKNAAEAERIAAGWMETLEGGPLAGVAVTSGPSVGAKTEISLPDWTNRS